MPINIQPIEKRQHTDGKFLDVHSIFYTIQGEGPFTGRPAVFIRLAGCNLQCPSCDTTYTEGRSSMKIEEILSTILCLQQDANFVPLIVITGGEPFRQDIGKLVRTLISCKYRVQIETNGTLYPEDISLPWSSVTIVCSPKAGKIHPKLLPRIDAFKYVLSYDSVDEQDGLPTFALNHTASPRVARPPEDNTKPVYLQPMDTGNDAMANLKNVQACVKSCMQYGYTLQLQTHKIVGVA